MRFYHFIFLFRTGNDFQFPSIKRSKDLRERFFLETPLRSFTHTHNHTHKLAHPQTHTQTQTEVS